jgi:glutamyl-tRNA synthetase
MARTRFAPSPTGSLHVGGVRTALYCYLWAAKHGSAFVLRIEDTDRARSTDEATAGILRDMAWCGLSWDEGPERPDAPYGPYFQSQRLELYDRYVEQLLAEGKAYEAWETGEELQAMRKEAEAAKENFRYRRIPYSDDDLARFRAEGRKPVVRLAAPGHDVTLTDAVLGDVTVEAEVLDDLVIRKADGFPTYHFAVVVDDHHMHIEMILRGQEHLMNTHKHQLIYDALGWSAVPAGHLPTIESPSGGKMSKRDKGKAARAAVRVEHKARGAAKGDYGWLSTLTHLPVEHLAAFMKKKHDNVATSEAIAEALGLELPMIEVMDFRKAGVLPEALLNYLALLGWSPGDDLELMSLEELVKHFDIARVKKTSAKFDPTKLRWMSGEYMKTLPDDTLLKHLQSWLEVVPSPIAGLDEARRRQLLAMYRLRAPTFVDMDQLARFFFVAPTSYDDKQVRKHLAKGGGFDRLKAAHGALVDVGRWEPERLRATVDQLCDQTGTKLGKWAQPLRIAVTGTGVSPDLYDTLHFLGRKETLKRLEHCLAHCPRDEASEG